MPRYAVRLEAQDGSGHFRFYPNLEAKDKKEAEEKARLKEYEMVVYQLSPEAEAAILEEAEVDSLNDIPVVPPREDFVGRAQWRQGLSGPSRARLNAHRQSDPYKVVSVEKAAS